MAKIFHTTAEYLHTFIGRRAAVPCGAGRIPITVDAARHHPESGLILVDGGTPAGMIHGIPLAVDTIIEVEHRA